MKKRSRSKHTHSGIKYGTVDLPKIRRRDCKVYVTIPIDGDVLLAIRKRAKTASISEEEWINKKLREAIFDPTNTNHKKNRKSPK
ncbi:MAG TPA: hypothetical protein DCS07_00800 [Bdellovibrionales bacterium]|nr:MAG: hypothetical protein A2Z97_04130 [Bdellovibrionales bacterium GWB1_52_6]OFZ02423.1 MAG: hypothetical protein A2X97_12805 [Bdellovibrionales bacterium GWA1_52_35]OFZ34353.1 MAG: hypothetical protein A2070_03040 [Bdellovibrionales bacterium GWC1_52_8]HAR41168.1 hypothetical protein [Bdellovibrionales bacterium]HCM41548.1 hypothetical protein [Bdellovibrionales bacterium]